MITRPYGKSCLALLGGISLCGAESWAQGAVRSLPEIRVVAPSPAELLQSQPGAIGRVVTIHLEDVASMPARMDEILVEAGVAHWNASNSLGLASGLGLRGFVASNQGSSQIQGARAYLNGHADVAWRFSRDPATVSSVQVLAGHDATLLGAGSPGGAVQYLSKTPTGTPFRRVSLGLNSAGGVRSKFDGEIHLGVLQLRAVMAAQRGQKTVEEVLDNRSAALVSARLPWQSGEARLDVEYHGNAMPFPFGTAYAGGQFWLDTPYVDSRSDASRHYRRAASYLEHQLPSGVTVSLHWQHAQSTRSETLLGFFDPLNANQLRGYYRLIDERNSQHDAGLRLSGSHGSENWKHRWNAVWQGHSQQRAFAGPQNIGGFTLNLAAPAFPADLSTLRLTPRFAFEKLRERGLGLASAWERGPLELRLGVRQSSIAIDSASLPNQPLLRQSEARPLTNSAGVGWRISPLLRTWVSRSESFLPNRGKLSGGAYLPPTDGTQWEMGLQHKQTDHELTLQVYDLRQTNLPARDPNDRDAFVVLGSQRSRGVTLSGATVVAGWRLSASGTRQDVQLANPAVRGLGPFAIGVPDTYGSAKAEYAQKHGRWTAQIVGAASLPGDTAASFRSPGWGVWNLAWESPQRSKQLQWGVRLDNVFDRRYVRGLTGADNVWQGERRKFALWAAMPL